jgi:hypothetical protein
MNDLNTGIEGQRSSLGFAAWLAKNKVGVTLLLFISKGKKQK